MRSSPGGGAAHIFILDLSDPHGGEGGVAQDDVNGRIRIRLQVDEQQQKVSRR